MPLGRHDYYNEARLVISKAILSKIALQLARLGACRGIAPEVLELACNTVSDWVVPDKT